MEDKIVYSTDSKEHHDNLEDAKELEAFEAICWEDIHDWNDWSDY